VSAHTHIGENEDLTRIQGETVCQGGLPPRVFDIVNGASPDSGL
jgi:hypothetical protein